MKKRILSILLTLCMVLSIAPATVFAEDSVVTEVSTAEDLTTAIENSAVDTVKLAADIIISSSLTVNRAVTLDLNGHVLKYESANNGSVIVVENGGQLTIEDSNTSKLSHKFKQNGKLWVLDETSGTETVTGGVITGGTGTDISTFGGTTWYCGGGALIKNGGSLTMRGGNIIGCSAECGGGVCIDSEQGQFSMSGGSIAGCVASDIGGGVFASGTFKMSGPAVIRSCTAESATQYVCGGGVYVNGSSFEMSDTAIIEGCQAISTSSNSSRGGGVFVNSSSSFVMSNEAKIEGCQAISNSSKPSKGGGVHLSNNTKFTLSGSAVIQNCTATNSANSGEAYGGGVSAACVKEITLADSARIVGCAAANGSGLYITGSQVPGYGILHANNGSVDGDVVLGDTEDGPCTITGSGGTVFNGKVTVTPGSTIESGTFNGEVINNGTITGGVFNNTVSGSGTITGGTFNTPMTGSGTETDPYQISTADQLKLFRDIVNGAGGQSQNRGACAVLTAAIDLNNEPWTPIGNYTEGNQIYYEGTFDGGGHTISGLNVTGNFRCASLFGAVKGGTIKNLTVAGNVSHNYYSGLDCHVGGIVGSALDAATIENCSNNCSVTGSSSDYIGGIAGSNINNARIIDCYNVGTITGTILGTGGVTGFNVGTISHCYNVGTIKALYYSDAVGEIVGHNCGTVENCYYLAGTNLNAVGRNDRTGNITKTESKTAANFANDTVLALLKADRDNNADPWADECKYLNAAGKTLPVFNGQGDAHDHQSNDWKSNETEHWQVCTCGAVFHKEEHSGGKATCTEKAKCAVCGAEYGDVLGHDFTTSWTHDDNEHWKQCSRCDIKDDVSPHTWNNGTITTAPTCTKAGKKTYSCTKCDATKIEPIPATGHSWKSDWTSDATHHWHECANENCDVTDNAGKDGYAEHSGGTATCTEKAVCTHCGQSYGETNPVNHTGTEQWTQTTTTHEKKWNCCNTVSVPNENHEWADGVCSECGYVCLHEDTDKNHICDICGKTISDHKDADNNHLCDYCGEKISNHTGGKATCKDKAKCEFCGESYGELNANNHSDLKHFPAVAATKTSEGNIEYWYCNGCGKYYSDKDGTKEIKKADTVTTKLKDDSKSPQTGDSKSPQTGDNSNLLLWIALLFISGGACTALTVKRKYRHGGNAK